MDTKKALILFGSPHKNGGTNEAVVWAEEKLAALGFETDRIYVYQKKINPCIGCARCQKTDDEFGCMQKDDVADIAQSVMDADLIIAATPVHGSYMSAPLKSLLDRLVYIMNKYVGRTPENWHSLWDSKHFAALISYAVKYDEMLVPMDVGMRLYCDHSRLFYDGCLGIHRKNYMMRQKNGDEDYAGDKEKVYEFINNAAAQCLKGKKADWDAHAGYKKK